MIKFLIASLLFLSLFNVEPESNNCNCEPYSKKKFKERTTFEFDNASVVFLGKLISVEDLDKTPIGKLSPINVPIKYTFEVNEMIKGNDALSTIEVYTDQPNRVCSTSFEEGRKYLIYGKHTLQFQKYIKKKWSFKTAECMGNTQRRYTEKKKLDLLRKLAK